MKTKIMKNQKKSFVNYFVVFCALILATFSAAQAATFTVNMDSDLHDTNPGDGVCAAAYRTCTLRAAIEESNVLPGKDVIQFSSSFQAPNQPRTIVLSLGWLEIKESLQITGPGARQLAVDGNQKNHVFYIQSKANNAFITGLTIQNGYAYYTNFLSCAPGICNKGTNTVLAFLTVRNNVGAGDDPTEGEYGGGIANFGSMSLNSSTVTDNKGGYGGGIVNLGTMFVNNTTVTGNTSQHSGGGIFNHSGTAKIVNATVTGNQSAKPGAGIWTNQSGALEMLNTIVADNIGRIDPDVSGTIASLGTNLVKTRGASNGYVASDLPDETDPLLGELQNNGGQTDTRALIEGSPAINAGNNCTTVAPGCLGSTTFIVFDQRGPGFLRKIGSKIDFGAVESVYEDAVPVVEIGGTVLKPNGSGLNKSVVTLTDEKGVTRSTETDSHGHYSFGDVVTGKAYVVKVETRHYEYNSQELVFDGARDDVNFVPIGRS